MFSTTNSSFLRKVLLADAASCVAAGALMAFGAGTLSGLLNLPFALLLGAGIALFPVAAFMAVVATRARLSASAVWLVIVGNVSWIVGSLWVMVGMPVMPNALGQSFVAGQAVVVAVLSFLEYRGVTQLAAVA